MGLVIPLSSQLSTLIFGHIRKNKNSKYLLQVSKQQADLQEDDDSDDNLSTLGSELRDTMMSEGFNFFNPPLVSRLSSFIPENYQEENH